MKLLLDTQLFLWFITGNTKLSLSARQLIEDLSNEKFVSIASIWEIAIKNSLGKLQLKDDFDVLFPAQITAIVRTVLKNRFMNCRQL